MRNSQLSSQSTAHQLDPYSRVIPGYSALDAATEAARLNADQAIVCFYMRQYGDRDVRLSTVSGIQVVPAYEAFLRTERGDPVRLL